jgi:hypothetical protein
MEILKKRPSIFTNLSLHVKGIEQIGTGCFCFKYKFKSKMEYLWDPSWRNNQRQCVCAVKRLREDGTARRYQYF